MLLAERARCGACRPRLGALRESFGDRAYLALTLRRRPGEAVRLRRLADLARAAGIATVATGDVLYHVPRAAHPAGRA